MSGSVRFQAGNFGGTGKARILWFDSVADARARPDLFAIADAVEIKDAGIFYADPASVVADNGINAFQVTGINPGRFIFSPGSFLVNGVPVDSFEFPSDSVSITPGGTATIDGGVLPNYVYGRDARLVLDTLLNAGAHGVAMFGVGDSRLYGVQTNGELNKWNPIVPIGGAGRPAFVNANPGGLLTTSLLSAGANVVTNSVIYAGETINGYSVLNSVSEFNVSTGGSVTALNFFWNRFAYMDLSTAVNDPWLTLMRGKAIDCVGLYRVGPAGIVANSINFRAYANGDHTHGAPNAQTTAGFSTYAASAAIRRAKLQFPVNTDWGPVGGETLAPFFALESDALMVVNETVSLVDGVWLELSDGTGLAYHDLALGGQITEDWVDLLTGSRVMNQRTASAWSMSFELRCGNREPVFLIDLGTNGASFGANQSEHEAILIRIIEKLRRISGYPNAKAILTTAYPGSETPSTSSYYSLAAISVARRLAGVACVDTYHAAADGGGYAAAVAKGWFGGAPDGTHRVRSGREARASMWAAIVSGDPWTWSNTLG